MTVSAFAIPEILKRRFIGKMTMKNRTIICRNALALLRLFVTATVVAQTADDPIVDRIRHEAAANSHVFEYLQTLSDRYGPRVSGTPNYRAAADWVVKALKEADVDNVTLDRYRADVPGWDIKNFSFNLVEPRYAALTAMPAAWSKGLDVPITTGFAVAESLTLVDLAKLRGEMHDKFVLIASTRPLPKTGPSEYDDETLQRALYRNGHYVPDGLGGSGEETSQMILQDPERYEDDELLEIVNFLVDEGAAAVVVASSLDFGVLEVTDVDFFPVVRTGIRPPPVIFLSREHHGRVSRLIEAGDDPRAKLQMTATYYSDPEYAVNIIAEIPGNDRSLKDEVILLGAHFDTWHGSPGVADNGAGVAVMMEALRILRTIEVLPRRTIRIGLWGGEEQGVFSGSLSYATDRFGDLADAASIRASQSHRLYLNQDTGTGKIRGIFLHGNELARPFFEYGFAMMKHLPVDTITTEDSSGSDQVVFDAYNVPAFEFIQDPVLYGTYQHHTNMDVMELAKEENLRHNATVVATLAYLAAMQEVSIPRKPEAEQ